MIADPAGTVVDGDGAGFYVTGGNNNIATGLVFASAAGVPLAKVTVANLIVSSFTGSAIHVCGGEFPSCTEDVSDTFVNRVVANGAHADAIRVSGRNVRKTRVVESVGLHADGAGIRVIATGSVVGWRIQGCTVRASDELGIAVLALGDIVGGAILDTTVFDNRSGISVLSDGRVEKLKIANVVEVRSLGVGIFVRGDAGTNGVVITDTAVTANISGIVLRSEIAHGAPTLTNVVVDTTFAEGLTIAGETVGAKINRTVALANGATGLLLSENALGASVKSVVTAGNGADGLTIRGSNSTLQKIRADGNRENGIRLTALLNGLTGTSSGNAVQKSVASGNGGHGIFLTAGTTNSRVQKNAALGNDAEDLRDANPSCDANVWSANTFRRGTDPCIR